MNRHFIGIDIGGTSVKMGLFDSDSFPRILSRRTVATVTDNGGERILPDVAEAVRAWQDEGVQIDGLAVGVPGAVIAGDKPGSTLVNRCVNLGWGVKDVAGERSALTGVGHVEVLNDANAAALGETAAIAENLAGRTIVLVTIGTGVGGGIVQIGTGAQHGADVQGSRIVRGAFGAAGEIGHMKIAPHHPLLSRLRAAGAEIEAFADFEYYVSAGGIRRIAEGVLKLPEPTKLRDLPQIDAVNAFTAARAGDKPALEMTEFYFDTFGVGLAAVAAVIDPDMFIIGGGVSHEGQFLLDGIRKAYRKYAFHASMQTDFRLAALGNDAGMTGLAAALMERES